MTDGNLPLDRCLLIAEIGINHEGDVETCIRMVEAAAEAGADAVKLQTVDADLSYDPESPSHSLFKSAALTREETALVFRRAHQLGMLALTTSADPNTLDWVDALGPDAHKISSGLLTTTPLIRHAAKTGRPLIMSTGMAEEADIDRAVEAARAGGVGQLVLLHCTSLYPAPRDALNLSAIPWLRQKWGLATGYSDHSIGTDAAPVAVALGACVIEKHFTLDPTRPGFDHGLSLDAAGFATLVRSIRQVETMLGRPGRVMTPEERAMRAWAHRILVATRDLHAGMVLGPDDLTYRRPKPGIVNGVSPHRLDEVIGQRVRVDITSGAAITMDMLTAGQED